MILSPFVKPSTNRPLITVKISRIGMVYTILIVMVIEVQGIEALTSPEINVVNIVRLEDAGFIRVMIHLSAYFFVEITWVNLEP